MGLLDMLKRPSAKAAKPQVVMRELPAPPPVAVVPVTPVPAVPSADELRQQLFDALAAGYEARFTALCREHRELIAEYAPLWMIVPDSLLANPAAAEWYTRGLEQLTRQALS